MTYLFVQVSRWVALAACLSLPLRVHAQTSAPVPAEQDRAARGLFDAGTLAFREGRYEAALQHFEEAHRLSQRPLLLFNIASSLDRLRRDQEALATFERYLQELPQAPNHQAVEARIALLRKAIEDDAAERAKAEAALAAATTSTTTNAASPPVIASHDVTTTTAAPASDGLPTAVVWIGLGVTGVLAIVSTWSGLDTVSANDDYLAAPTKAAYEDALSRQSRTNVLIGVTSAAAATTLVLALLADWGGRAETSPVAQAWVAPDGAGISVRGEL